MALLPGYRYLKIGEIIPEGAIVDWGKNGTTTKATLVGSACAHVAFYMVPVPKARRARSYMPPETSLEAHASQSGKAPNDRIKILQFIVKSTETGCTCDEVETLLQYSHQTASARIRDLTKLSLIKDSGLRRKTRTGRSATVWKVA